MSFFSFLFLGSGGMKKGVSSRSRHGKIGQIKAEKRAFKTRNSSNSSTASQPGKVHELDTDNEEEGVEDRGGREKTEERLKNSQPRTKPALDPIGLFQALRH